MTGICRKSAVFDGICRKLMEAMPKACEAAPFSSSFGPFTAPDHPASLAISPHHQPGQGFWYTHGINEQTIVFEEARLAPPTKLIQKSGLEKFRQRSARS
jgi:hypothetical protein